MSFHVGFRYNGCLQCKWIFTCDEGTWERPDRWGCGGSSALVGWGSCWTQSYSCSLKGRTPVEEEDNKTRVSEQESPTSCSSQNQACRLEESIETGNKCLDHDAVLLYTWNKKSYVQSRRRDSAAVFLDYCSSKQRIGTLHFERHCFRKL